MGSAGKKEIVSLKQEQAATPWVLPLHVAHARKPYNRRLGYPKVEDLLLNTWPDKPLAAQLLQAHGMAVAMVSLHSNTPRPSLPQSGVSQPRV